MNQAADLLGHGILSDEPCLAEDRQTAAARLLAKNRYYTQNPLLGRVNERNRLIVNR